MTVNGAGHFTDALQGLDAAGGTPADADRYGLQVTDPVRNAVPSPTFRLQPLLAGNVLVS